MTGTPSIQKRLVDWIDLFDSVKRFEDEYGFSTIALRWLSAYNAKPPNSLDIAAKTFELDLAYDHDKDLLLRILADIAFGKRALGRPKGTKRWNSASHFMLGFHADLNSAKEPQYELPTTSEAD